MDINSEGVNKLIILKVSITIVAIVLILVIILHNLISSDEKDIPKETIISLSRFIPIQENKSNHNGTKATTSP